MRPCLPKQLLTLFAAAAFGVTLGCGVGSQPPSVSAAGSVPQKPPFSQNVKAPSEQASQPIVVPANQVIYVRLQQSISSATAEAGQSFAAVLDQPLVIEGKTVAPEGAPVNGRVLAARQSGHLHNAGYLRVTLSSIAIDGKSVPVQTKSIFIQGRGYKKRNLAYIGGGAGGGALLGALIGGGKGALIGSAIGAGGGTTAAYITGKKEVGFAAERRLGFRLAQPLNLTHDSRS
jgi:hypothetical protein